MIVIHTFIIASAGNGAMYNTERRKHIIYSTFVIAPCTEVVLLKSSGVFRSRRRCTRTVALVVLRLVLKLY